MFTYINQAGEKKIKTFVYKGGSDSLAYQYLWSPFAEYLLKFTPKHIAPNLITMFSLIILSTAHIVFVVGLESDSKIAAWRSLLIGFSILIYQNLDNLDGKQARKTKSSSPLGMLFDHGADSVCSFLISIVVLQLLQIKSGTIKIFIMLVVVMMVYFAAMWSQYCMGFFRLGRINPIDQGLPCYALFAILSIFLPYNFFNSQTAFGRYNQVLLYGILGLVFVVIYFMVRDNYSKTQRERSDINYVLILPLNFLAVLSILYLHQRNIFQECYWPIMYSLTFAWSKNMIQIQLCAVTEQRYNPFNISTFIFVLMFLAPIYVKVNANTYFSVVAFIMFLLFLEFTVSICNQISNILNIRVFKIQSKEEKNQ